MGSSVDGAPESRSRHRPARCLIHVERGSGRRAPLRPRAYRWPSVWRGSRPPFSCLLVGGRHHAAGARLDDGKIDLADTHRPPAVLVMRLATVDNDVGSKTIHRDREVEAIVEFLQRALRQQQKRIGVGKGNSVPGLGGARAEGACIVAGEPNQPCADPEVVGKPRRRGGALVDRVALVAPHRDPNRRFRFALQRYVEIGQVGSGKQEPVFSQFHPHQRQPRLLALTQETAVLTHHHPPPVPLKPSRRDPSGLHLNPTAGFHWIDVQGINADHSSRPLKRSTEPAAVVRAG